MTDCLSATPITATYTEPADANLAPDCLDTAGVDTPPTTRTEVTNVCPIFGTGSGAGYIVELQVEYTTYDECTGMILSTTCVTNPVGCCGIDTASSDCNCPDCPGGMPGSFTVEVTGSGASLGPGCDCADILGSWQATPDPSPDCFYIGNANGWLITLSRDVSGAWTIAFSKSSCANIVFQTPTGQECCPVFLDNFVPIPNGCNGSLSVKITGNNAGNCACVGAKKSAGKNTIPKLSRAASFPAAVAQSYKKQLLSAKESLPAYNEAHEGRGIVISAGGVKCLVNAWVCVSLLRKHGCQLPIQIWYIGPEEIDRHIIKLFKEKHSVDFVDSLHIVDKKKLTIKNLGGWENKAFAIIHSPFKEVLFLDADQVPVVDPTYLFENVAYKDVGAMFWPDYFPYGWRIKKEVFELLDLNVPGNSKKPEWVNPTDYIAFETGQILIDKSRHWDALHLWQEFGQQAEFWYSACKKGAGVDLVYGDKDTAYLAWELLHKPYLMAPTTGWVGSDKSGAFIQHDWDNNIVFQHKCQPNAGKWNLYEENAPCPDFQYFEDCLQALKELKFKWLGKLWDWNAQTEQEKNYAMPLVGEKQILHKDKKITTVSLLPDGRAISSNPEIRTWSIRIVDQPYINLVGDNTVHCFFGLDNYENWMNHGKGLFFTDPPPASWLPWPDWGAAGAYNDVYKNNAYELPDKFNAEDIIIDCGAHVGIFSKAVLDRGAKNIFAVECNPEMIKHLRHNLKDKVKVIPYAAWGNDEDIDAVLFDDSISSIDGTVTASRGKIVVAVKKFDDIVLEATDNGTKRIRFCKIDIEGAEYPCVQTSKTLHLIDDLVVEYHLDKIPSSENSIFTVDALIATLNQQGFEVKVKPLGPVGLIFAKKLRDAK
jgi:FkbM family methyltransferase